MLHLPHKLSLFSALFFVVLGFCIYTNRVEAKAVSVKDIIRQDTTGTKATLSTDSIPQEIARANQPHSYTDTPLFLSPVNLHNKTQEVENSWTHITGLYTWTQNLLATQTKEAEDARMVITDGRVIDFNPGQEGLYPDSHATTLALLRSLQTGTVITPITFAKTNPQVSLDSTNALGIHTLLSGGISDFSNSSKNRLANIEAGMQQVRGVIVKPGETFSFGEYLGDVTAEKGFKPEIVIKAEGLVPELGGGICQVSSTLFRAVMQSGMQITQRRNHAFSVSHYFPPGTDATIYTPATDLKFINDTPAHVLIWPYYLDKTHLAFDLYGTSDNRNVTVDEPIQWDRKPDGSMKASWSRHVTKNGITRDDTLKSTYLPPALFKKEEKFVVNTPPASTTSPATPAPVTAPPQ